ncbi:hypothetical protein [Shewanella metallivivens]|uniref:Uncharacterized protein n=1 Tax=Shewanella metallivivens TaxID=2872342 RepID=A0ABT5THG1_9GAMM|nr:hypothetical protein [Shewanella metallivivens]MDD8057618.1 hypothetical protein [Shewanella metallivivens]
MTSGWGMTAMTIAASSNQAHYSVIPAMMLLRHSSNDATPSLADSYSDAAHYTVVPAMLLSRNPGVSLAHLH